MCLTHGPLGESGIHFFEDVFVFKVKYALFPISQIKVGSLKVKTFVTSSKESYCFRCLSESSSFYIINTLTIWLANQKTIQYIFVLIQLL